MGSIFTVDVHYLFPIEDFETMDYALPEIFKNYMD